MWGGLPEVCLALLKERHLTFATAESCTGGRVAERITALPGASAVYRGGVVSYWTEVKAAVLGVPQPLLDQYGAVSEECARAMAEGARRITGADLAVSVTGVAGPDPDERGRAGGYHLHRPCHAGGYLLPKDGLRPPPADRIRALAANHAFDLIRRYLTGAAHRAAVAGGQSLRRRSIPFVTVRYSTFADESGGISLRFFHILTIPAPHPAPS